MQEPKKKVYHPALDLMRIIAILAVVLIHTTTRTLEASKFDLTHFQWALFLNQASRFAVPLFFVISGFVLELSHSFNSSYLEYLKKRFNRVFLPYIFWSLVYYFFVFTNHTIKTFSFDFISMLLNGDASYQLYFIPTLLIFYLLFPLLHRATFILNNKFVLTILLVIQLGLLFYDYYIHELHINLPLRVALLNFDAFILGMIMYHHKQRLWSFFKKWNIFICILILILMFSIYYEGYSLYLKTNNYITFYSQWRPSIFVYSLLIAGFLYFALNRLNGAKVIKVLASLSFFVFFIHIIVLEIIWQTIISKLFITTNGKIAQNPFYDPLYFMVVAIVSFSIAFIIHKFPRLKNLTG